MAKIAVRSVIDSLLLPKWSAVAHNSNKDLIIIVGKGKGSEEGRAVLMPVVTNLLKDEYDIDCSVEKTNLGRICVSSSSLQSFAKRSR